MKQYKTLLIFLITFTIFILIKPPFITYTTLCSTYTDDVTCFDDMDCIWDFDFQLCEDVSGDTTISCPDHIDEFACTSANCEWDYSSLTCFEYTADTSESSLPQISQLQTLQNNPEIQEIIQALGIDISTIITSLSDYALQIQTTNQDIALSDIEKQDMILNIQTQIDSLLIDTPQSISITNKISGLPSTPLEDITQEMAPGLDESVIDQIYSTQNKMQAITTLKTFKLISFSQEEIIGTLITKTVTTPVQEGYIIEVIPLVTVPEDIFFMGEYEVLSYSPVALKIPFFTQAVYSYILTQDVFTQISQIQTGFIPYSIDMESKVQVKCGDGICTELLEDAIACPEDCAKKIPWFIIIGAIVAIIIIILFFHFFRDKLNFLKLSSFKKDKLFPSKSDKQNLKNYVKESLKENIPVDKIKSILISKDWTKEQVELIFTELEQEAKAEEPAKEEPEETPKETEESKEPLEI